MADNLQSNFRKSGYWLILVVPVVVVAIIALKGITWPWQVPPSADRVYEQQCAEYGQRLRNASSAKQTMLRLRSAALKFREHNQRWPRALDEMPRSPWSAIPPEIKALWTFELLDGEELLRATSTNAMPDGAGKVITLTLRETSWEGYSIEEPPVKRPLAQNEDE